MLGVTAYDHSTTSLPLQSNVNYRIHGFDPLAHPKDVLTRLPTNLPQCIRRIAYRLTASYPSLYRVTMQFLAFSILIAGILRLAFAGRRAYREAMDFLWIKLTAEVVHTEVEWRLIRTDIYACVPSITFKFHYLGTNYSCTAHPFTTGSWNRASSICKNYTEGSCVDVYVLASNPKNARLHLGIEVKTWAQLTLGLFLVAISVTMILLLR